MYILLFVFLKWVIKVFFLWFCSSRLSVSLLVIIIVIRIVICVGVRVKLYFLSIMLMIGLKIINV